jgi:hypothetical protein
MRIGVVSEGPADFAVVRNVIKGALGLDGSDVDSIRPELNSDETDLNAPGARSFSNWQIVREECTSGAVIAEYLDFADDRIVVAHVDTAECELQGFDVARPSREREDYVVACREAVLVRAREWLAGRGGDQIVFAIAVEETDAWLLAVYAVKVHGDTGAVVDPKRRLFDRELPRTNRLSDRERAQFVALRRELDKYGQLSQPLRKFKALSEAAARNASLDAFVRDLRTLAKHIDPTLPCFAP